jgi:hypothetical protein
MRDEGSFIYYKATLESAKSRGIAGFTESDFKRIYDDAIDDGHIKMQLAIKETVNDILTGLYESKLDVSNICKRT